MIEKRFTPRLENNRIVWITDTVKEKILFGEDTVELLNAQHEEIEKLKKEKEQLIQSIQDGAKMAADRIVKSMDKNFTLDTKYYRK